MIRQADHDELPRTELVESDARRVVHERSADATSSKRCGGLDGLKSGQAVFDEHAHVGNQLVTGSPLEGEHARLLKELADALAAFYAALKALGLGSAVTTFTQSDFGRTFAPNNSTGTDHAWGNQHLVLGGAVKGATTYGTYPDLVLGGDNDVGQSSWELQGRWIPTTAVDQYAATLLSWFGASDTQLDSVLPNLKNFGAARKLAFL